jgi:hypothetical protein
MSDLIQLIPDATIEPGHQMLAIDIDTIDDDLDGFYLAAILNAPLPPEEWTYDENGRRALVPHTADVDTKIVTLINELAHVRFSAPTLVQLTLSSVPIQEASIEDDGTEGA